MHHLQQFCFPTFHFKWSQKTIFSFELEGSLCTQLPENQIRFWPSKFNQHFRGVPMAISFNHFLSWYFPHLHHNPNYPTSILFLMFKNMSSSPGSMLGMLLASDWEEVLERMQYYQLPYFENCTISLIFFPLFAVPLLLPQTLIKPSQWPPAPQGSREADSLEGFWSLLTVFGHRMVAVKSKYLHWLLLSPTSCFECRLGANVLRVELHAVVKCSNAGWRAQ